MSGWPVVRLDECCQIVSGATPRTSVREYWGGDIPWATPKDLSELTTATISDTPRKLTTAGLSASSATLLPPGSVLFSSRAPIGHVAINTVAMATNQGFKSFVPSPERIHVPYLYWWLQVNRVYLQGLGNGATFKEVSKAVVSRIEIPLPPLPEQRRIADILDQADAVRVKRRAARAKLDDLARSIFLELFGDPVTNPNGWPEDRVLGDVANIMSGITKGRKLTGAATRKVPYLAVVNVQDRRLDLNTVKTIEATEAEISRYQLKLGDLLLTEGGDSDKLGRGSLWSEEISECIHQNHIFRVRLADDRLTPLFLNWLIGSERGKRYFLKSAKQTTGIASINLLQLRAFPILTPPLALQQRFAAAIERVAALSGEVQQSVNTLDALFASLQYRAFRAEL